MRRTKRGGWPYSQPPNVPFEINRASPQSEGLALWMPWGGGTPGTHRHVDRVSGLVFTETGTPEWRHYPERGWMLHFTIGDSDSLVSSSTPVIAPPLTLSTWFVMDSNITTWDTQSLLTITDPAVGDAGEHFAIRVNTQATITAWRIEAQTRDAVGTGVAAANRTGDWELHHIAGVFRSPTDRRLYYDGRYVNINTTSRTPAAIDRVVLGAKWGWGNPMYEFWGLLGDGRVYNVAKTDAGVYQMYANPWELCKPLVRRWVGWKAAVGGVTYYQSCAGALTYTGSIAKKTSKGLSGALTYTGSIVKKTSISVSGTLTFVGGLVKKTSISVSGALTFVGSLDAKGLFKQALSGALTFVGALGTVLLMRQALSGALSYIGSLATQYTAGPGGAWVRWIDHRLMKWRKKFE